MIVNDGLLAMCSIYFLNYSYDFLVRLSVSLSVNMPMLKTGSVRRGTTTDLLTTLIKSILLFQLILNILNKSIHQLYRPTILTDLG